MLLNLTNHPCQCWPTDQQKAAELLWGSVRDYPFPAVAPEATTHQVALLARETVRQAAELHPDAVLCQGEMTLTLVLTALLQREGIPVYAAVSSRCTRERKEGQTVVKTSEFRFRRSSEQGRRNCLRHPCGRWTMSWPCRAGSWSSARTEAPALAPPW